MAETTNLTAISHVTGGVSTPDNALGAPDGLFTTDANSNTSWTSRWAMATLAGSIDPSAHNQTITLRIRKGINANDPSVTAIRVIQNGTDITGNLLVTAQVITATGAGTDLGVTFAGNLLNGVEGVSVEVATAANGGGPNARNAVELDAITWALVYDVGFAREGEVGLSGAGAFGGAARRDRSATAAFSGAALLAASAGVSFNRQAASILAATSAVSGFVTRTQSGRAALVASGSVLADAMRGFLLPRETESDDTRITEQGDIRRTDVFEEYTQDPAQPGGTAFAGAGAIIAAALRTAVAATVLCASAGLAADATVTRSGAADLAATGSKLSVVVKRLYALSVLTGESGLVANALRTGDAVSALTGAGGITAASIRVAQAQTNMSGTGDLMAATLRTSPGAAVFAGGGDLAADPSRGTPAQTFLPGAGNLTADPWRRARAVAALAGQSGLAAQAEGASPGEARLGGAGSLTAASLHILTVAASAGGESGLVAAPLRTRSGGAVLAGEGSAALDGAATRQGAATLIASGSKLAAADRGFTSFVFLAGVGGLTAAVSADYAAGAPLVGAGNLIAASVVLASGRADLFAHSARVALAAVRRTGGAVLPGTGALAAAGSVTSVYAGSVALQGVGDLAGTAARTSQGTAGLIAQGSKLSAVFKRVFALASFTSAGALEAGGFVPEQGVVTLVGEGALAANERANLQAGADFAATGSVLFAFGSTYLADAALVASGSQAVAAARVAHGVATMSGGSQFEAGGIVAIFGAAQLTGTGTIAANGEFPFDGGIFVNVDGDWLPVTPYFATGENLIRAIQSGQMRITELDDFRALSETEWFAPRDVYVKQAGQWLRTY